MEALVGSEHNPANHPPQLHIFDLGCFSNIKISRALGKSAPGKRAEPAFQMRSSSLSWPSRSSE